jgi:predicted dehydrogenase
MDGSINELKFGLVGNSRTGLAYALACEELESLRLTCVCGRNPDRPSKVAPANTYDGIDELLGSGDCDALIIATSLENRSALAMQALEKGFSVLVVGLVSEVAEQAEKLAAVVAKSRGKLLCCPSRPLRFAPRWQKLKELTEGAFGRPYRIHWTLTDRFRTEHSFIAGEGAEKLMEDTDALTSQLTEELDLLLWLCGTPDQVETLHCVGKHHDIQVEDEVLMCMAWEDGATGTLVSSSGEVPGIDRLEMVSDRGMIVSEANQPIRWSRCEVSAEEFSLTIKDSNERPSLWEIEIPMPKIDRDFFPKAVLSNFEKSFHLDGRTTANVQDDVDLLRFMDRMVASKQPSKDF